MYGQTGGISVEGMRHLVHVQYVQQGEVINKIISRIKH